ncbi:hypothetical protein FQZ97_987760 [compost metagenome]
MPATYLRTRTSRAFPTVPTLPCGNPSGDALRPSKAAFPRGSVGMIRNRVGTMPAPAGRFPAGKKRPGKSRVENRD